MVANYYQEIRLAISGTQKKPQNQAWSNFRECQSGPIFPLPSVPATELKVFSSPAACLEFKVKRHVRSEREVKITSSSKDREEDISAGWTGGI